MSASTEQRKLAAIMFTDMAGYSALAQRNETLAIELLEEQRGLLRSLFGQFNGVEVDCVGDGFFVEFASALEATRCAVEIQRVLADRNKTEPPQRHIRLRIGIHVGDVVHRGDKVMGDAVNIAARIEPLATPGGICISNAVYEQVRNKVEFPLVRFGEPELKNIEVPVVVYRVVLDGSVAADVTRRENLPRSHDRNQEQRLRQRWKMAFATGVFALIVLNVFLFLKFGSPSSDSASSNTTPGRITSLAVKPLDDFSGDTNQAYLSDGMTEALCSALGNISALRVPGRSSVMRYKGGTKSIAEIAVDLKVDAVLEGSIQRAANRILITVQLIEAASDRHLWATNYERDLSDFFKVQSEVARAIAAEIKIRVAPEDATRLANARAAKAEAVDAYLKGRYHWYKRTEDGLKRGLDYFNQAIEKDPNYALAHAGIAYTYVLLGHEFYCVMHPRDAYPKAKAAALKALELDETLAEAHAVLAYCHFLYDWDWTAAERQHKRAIELSANFSVEHIWYSHYLLPMGRVDESLAESRRALEIDPLGPIINVHLAWHYLYAGDYENAIKQSRATLELAPEFAIANWVLGQAYEQTGRFDAAVAEFQKGVRISGQNPFHLAALAHGYAISGRRAEAEKILAELKATQRYVPSYEIAVIYAGLNQKEEALAWLERAHDQRDSSWLVDVGLDPRFRQLRSEPRFTALLKKLGLDK